MGGESQEELFTTGERSGRRRGREERGKKGARQEQPYKFRHLDLEFRGGLRAMFALEKQKFQHEKEHGQDSPQDDIHQILTIQFSLSPLSPSQFFLHELSVLFCVDGGMFSRRPFGKRGLEEAAILEFSSGFLSKLLNRMSGQQIHGLSPAANPAADGYGRSSWIASGMTTPKPLDREADQRENGDYSLSVVGFFRG